MRKYVKEFLSSEVMAGRFKNMDEAEQNFYNWTKKIKKEVQKNKKGDGEK